MTQEGCCRCSPLLGRAPLRTCVLKGHDTPVLTLASADEPRPRLHGERLLTQYDDFCRELRDYGDRLFAEKFGSIPIQSGHTEE